jgi:U3 small nucleolar ribonucleoprotein protein LCP5
MAAPTTLPALLDSLTQSLASAQEIPPRVEAIEQPKDGISLLDVKNELLLSYLQNLVFLILLKLRNAKSDSETNSNELDETVRAKLVELRLYLERGARPLEEKLKFSIERFLRTAQDAEREEKQKAQVKDLKGGSDSVSESGSGDDEDEDSEASEEERRPVKPVAGRRGAAPNLGAMADDVTARPARDDDTTPSGIYRPPKRERQLMETTTGRREKSDRRPNKSHTMDEFVADEFSTAPVAEPSIGTTIVNRGRSMKTASQRKTEDERREYEETNFVRLPKETKKDKAKKAKQEGRGRMTFGGEEWHNLGEGVDRIDRLTKRKDGGRGSNVRALLDKSRKRGMDTTDGPRGSGQIGERYQKRVKLLEAGRRDRGKNR